MAYGYALLSWDEALRALHDKSATLEASHPMKDTINDALHGASEEIQRYLERTVIQKAWIEYHERSRREPSILRVLHWPISTVEIAEDNARDYTTALTAGTDYQVIHRGDQTSEIRRISGDSPTSWMSGFEAIRIKVTGGWLLANVPDPIQSVCRQFMARRYRDTVNQEQDIEQVSDARGQYRYSVPAMLTRPMKEALSGYKDWDATTCVRFELDSE